MSDDALLAWLNNGAPVEMDSEAAAARRRVAFSQRFLAAINPADDLGPTQELHDAAVALCVLAVHDELRALGIDEYDSIWQTLSAPVRASIKRCVALATESTTPKR